MWLIELRGSSGISYGVILEMILKFIWFNGLLFVWLLVDFVRVWRFGFGFERWDFVVVFGFILACGHGGG